MNIKTKILLRVYGAFGLIILLGILVLWKLISVQFIHGAKWRAIADSQYTKMENIEATRGNIYAADGSLLATSVPEYDVRIDFKAIRNSDSTVFYSKVDSLAICLSKLFNDKSVSEYNRLLRLSYKNSVRYLLLKRDVSFTDLKIIKHMPIFRQGMYKGGLMAIQKNKRVLPFKNLAARTIGYSNDNVANSVGLEGAYHQYIEGESGKRLVRRIAGGYWMPINEEDEVAPRDGADIIATIDVNMQDLAQKALLDQLILNDAAYGCVVLMEVQTGEVKAVANYTRVAEGNYAEKFNYAIAQSSEPGSTFKLASYLALIDNHKVNINSLVNCEGGKIKISYKTIQDSHFGLQTITVKKAFEESSNVAAAKLVYLNFKNNPQEYIDKLKSFHLHQKLQLQIPGEGRPFINSPKNIKGWNLVSLAQLAYGYEAKQTPLQTLTLYNAVANNGKMIAPLFVKEIRKLGSPVEQFTARVINPKIASDNTLKQVKSMLEGVVIEGTGKGIYTSAYPIAGKTGTAQIANANKGYLSGGSKSYQASFCGYFPANRPKYAMIVVIGDPKKGGYYASQGAGPVFRKISDRIYSSDIQMYDDVNKSLLAASNLPQSKAGRAQKAQIVYDALGFKSNFKAKDNYVKDATNDTNEDQNELVKKGFVPDVLGMGLQDALYLINNAGLKVQVQGFGKIISQSLQAGSQINKGQTITLELK